jgi:hypothetical protein
LRQRSQWLASGQVPVSKLLENIKNFANGTSKNVQIYTMQGRHGYHDVVSSSVSFNFARALAHSIRPSHSPNDVLDERLSVDVSSRGRPQEPAEKAPLNQCKHAASIFGIEGSHANISSTSSLVILM